VPTDARRPCGECAYCGYDGDDGFSCGHPDLEVAWIDEDDAGRLTATPDGWAVYLGKLPRDIAGF
jgi:hypothetical protein